MKLYYVADVSGVPALIQLEGVELTNHYRLDCNPHIRSYIRFGELDKLRIGKTIDDALELYLNWRKAKLSTARRVYDEARNKLETAKDFVKVMECGPSPLT